MPDNRISFWKRLGGLIDRSRQAVNRGIQGTVSALGMAPAKEFLFRRRPVHQETDLRVLSPGKPNRRELLRRLGLWPFLGLFAWPAQGKAKEKPALAARPPRIIITKSDEDEYYRLKDLDLEEPKTAAQRKKMPSGKIGELSAGRLISGSNLISMNMHARDLDYVSALATHYNTQERIFMTLKKCEEMGVDTIVLKKHNFSRFDLSKYWSEWGGNMQWIADVITTDINKYERLLVDHLELGASAAYLWGGASDIWYYQKKQDNIIKAFEIMKHYQIPVGIGAHQLDPIMFCEKEGLVPDFYIKTLHHDRYWSAHPKENRRSLEMYQKESEDHAAYHDNMFCHNHAETVAFMRDVKVPWIAFKVLAAGAIPPENGIQFAFESGADFICLGMFDWQVKEDAELVQKAAAQAGNRTRAWT